MAKSRVKNECVWGVINGRVGWFYSLIKGADASLGQMFLLGMTIAPIAGGQDFLLMSHKQRGHLI